jgi:L-ascorbate metabolism protein UlaG (beta-lactamase superfamily)
LGKDITAVKPGMLIEIEDIKVKTVEAYNRKHEWDAKLMHKKGIGVGYVVSVEGKKIYHAGDTDLVQEMDCLQDVDVAFLPIGGRDFTMDLSEAIEAARRIKPKVVIPMHRFATDPDEYKKLVEKDSLTKVVVLNIGETYQL